MRAVVYAMVVLIALTYQSSAIDVMNVHSNVMDEQILTFTMMLKAMSNGNLNASQNITEMNVSFEYYLDVDGDGVDDVVSTNIYIGEAIESRIKVGDTAFTYSGIAFAYPIEDLDADGIRDVLVNKMFGFVEPAGVVVFSRGDELWNYTQKNAILLAIPDGKEILVTQIMMDFMHPATYILKLDGVGNTTVRYVMSGLGYALPLDDINVDGVNEILAVKIVDVVDGYHTSGVFLVDGKTGFSISEFLETSEDEVATTIGQVVEDLDGDGVRDIAVEVIKQNESGSDVLLKVVSSKKAVKLQGFDDAVLWEKCYKNFVSAMVVDDVDKDGLPDLGVITYKIISPSPNIVYPTQAMQGFDYEFDIYRGYDGKLLFHFEFGGK